MNYGLYMSTSGVLASMYSFDVHSNNLANSSTHGFKADTPTFRQRLAARLEDHLPFADSNKLEEKLSAGVMLAPNRMNMAQGSMSKGGALDVAINGDGFFAVRDGGGKAGGDGQVRLTRDGRFTMDAKGTLVQASSGRPVLDTNDRPITLAVDLPANIDKDGTIRQRDTVVGKIQLTSVADPSRLEKVGDNLLAASPAALRQRTAASGTLEPGMVEESTVDPVRESVAMMEAERSINMGTQLIRYQDDAMGQAISTFGKVA